MATMVLPAATVREAVLDFLQRADRQPMELLTALGTDFSDSEIKQAVSELIHEGRIELTSQRILKRTA